MHIEIAFYFSNFLTLITVFHFLFCLCLRISSVEDKNEKCRSENKLLFMLFMSQIMQPYPRNKNDVCSFYMNNVLVP